MCREGLPSDTTFGPGTSCSLQLGDHTQEVILCTLNFYILSSVFPRGHCPGHSKSNVMFSADFSPRELERQSIWSSQGLKRQAVGHKVQTVQCIWEPQLLSPSGVKTLSASPCCEGDSQLQRVPARHYPTSYQFCRKEKGRKERLYSIT